MIGQCSFLVANSASVKKRSNRWRMQKTQFTSLGVWPVLTMTILIFGVVASGITLVRGAQELRSLHTALDQSQTKQNRLLAEHTRLLLERSTFAGLQTVEVVATQELQMGFPQDINEVMP